MKESAYKEQLKIAESQDDTSYWEWYVKGLRLRYQWVPGDIRLSKRHFGNMKAKAPPSGKKGYQDGFYGPVDWDNLPDAVKTIRKWREWSVKTLGEELGVSPRTIEDWECGRSKPTGPARKLLERIHMSELISIYGQPVFFIAQQKKNIKNL